MKKEKFQARLLRDWVIADNEIIRGGSVGILYEYQYDNVTDIDVSFADFDCVGWEEGKSFAGYPGCAPHYTIGTPEEMAEQYGPNLYVKEPLSPETIRKFEDRDRIFAYILNAEKRAKQDVSHVQDKFIAYKKKIRKERRNGISR